MSGIVLSKLWHNPQSLDITHNPQKKKQQCDVPVHVCTHVFCGTCCRLSSSLCNLGNEEKHTWEVTGKVGEILGICHTAVSRFFSPAGMMNWKIWNLHGKIQPWFGSSWKVTRASQQTGAPPERDWPNTLLLLLTHRPQSPTPTHRAPRLYIQPSFCFGRGVKMVLSWPLYHCCLISTYIPTVLKLF